MNKDNFLAVLTQDSRKASGKVLETNGDSTIFIYYAGPSSGPGRVDMPSGDELFANDLIKALKKMYSKNYYK